MQIRIRSNRRVLAAGAAMDVWPTGNYIEHMPKGTPQQRMGQYWQNVGNHLRKSIRAYEQSNHDG